MKILFIMLLSFKLLADCKLSIPERDLERAVNPPVIGHYLKCEDYKNERCICIDKINTWYAEIYTDSKGKRQLRESPEKKQSYLKKKSDEEKENEAIRKYEEKIFKKMREIAEKKLIEDGEV